MSPQPKRYFTIDGDEPSDTRILRARAEDVCFPLDRRDSEALEDLMAQFKSEENSAGLAAPQIGYSKRMIVYHVPEEFKQYRKDVFDLVHPTILINPEYQPIGAEKTIDWEGCFSVKNTMAEVPRFMAIRYQGYDLSGNKVEGTARGFLARLLQHEIGHLNGELFTDLIQEGCRSGPPEEMRAIRQKEREERLKNTSEDEN